ncbi:hypothetical protein [Actinomycetospora soli]|uniref:hypothetical protein n=1 Tax=Actinomycetospora soli TaxID=2893887 RepID=UPI001E63343A|nr:hypothetical protein [Actinomycetospora soli]MCD2191606.1 hypothetical protein [Actinomycetospora soli]
MLRLLDGEPIAAGGDARQVRLWLLKTWLLLAHPAAEYKDPLLADAIAPWHSAPAELYTWLVDETGEPPASLSAWAHRYEPPYRQDVNVPVIVLPNVRTGSQTWTFECFELSLQTVNVTLLFHPGWPIDHPGELEGTVVQLWPADLEVEIPVLPQSNHRPVLWRPSPWRLTFRDGTYRRETVPPLRAGTEPADLVRHLLL